MSPLRVAANTAAAVTKQLIELRRGRMLRKRYRIAMVAVVIAAAVLAAVLLAFAGGSGGAQAGSAAVLAKAEGGDPDSSGDSPGLGPVSFDAYMSAERTYPANVIPPAIAQRAEDTFNAIAAADAKKGDPKGAGHTWHLYEHKQNATEPDVIYAAGFDACAWRRDAGAAETAFQQVFKPQFDANVTGGASNLDAGIDRTMFALTVKNAHTRIYLTDGTAAGGGPTDPFAANFWRTDNGQLPAAAL